MKGFLKHFKPKDQSGGNPPEETRPASAKPEAAYQMPETVMPGKKPQEGGTSQKIVLELGDILHRIPPHLLKDGTHDPNQRIFFRMDELSANLAGGKATIPLSHIADRCPEIFKHAIGPEDDVEIFFPWSKLLDRVRNLKAMTDQQGSEKNNPAMNYKSATPVNQAIKIRSQQPAPARPAAAVGDAGPQAAGKPEDEAVLNALAVPAAPVTPSILNPPADLAAPTEAPVENPAPQSPLKRTKQNWFAAPPALTKLPAEPPAGAVTAPVSSATPSSLSLVKEPAPPDPGLILNVEKPTEPAAKTSNITRTGENVKSQAPVSKAAETPSRESATLAGEAARAKDIQQKLIEKLTADNEAKKNESNTLLVQLGEAKVEHEKKLQTLREDFARQIAVIKEERDKLAKDKAAAVPAPAAPAQPDPGLVAAIKQKDDALAKLTGEVQAHKKQIDAHKQQIDAIGKERDLISEAKAKADTEFAQAKVLYHQELESAIDGRDTIWMEKDLLAKQMRDEARAHEEKLNAVTAQHKTQQEDFSKQIDSLKQEHGRILAEKESLLSKHGEAADQERNTLIRQKDETLTKLGGEIEAHKKQIESLGKEKADALAAREKLAAEIALVTAAHGKNVQELQDGFAKQIETLKQDHSRSIAEKDSLLSKHGEAADREKNELIRQKDETLAKLGGDIEVHKKQAETLGKEKAEALEAKGKLTAEIAQVTAAHGKNVQELQDGFSKQTEAHRQQIEALGREKAETLEAKEKLTAEIALVTVAHGKNVQELQDGFSKQIEALKQEHGRVLAEKDSLLSKHGEAADREKNELIRQKDESLARLTGEIEAHKKHIETLGGENAEAVQAKLRLAAEIEQIKAEHEKNVQVLQEDFSKQTAGLQQEHHRVVAEKESMLAKQSQAAGQERDNLTAQKDSAIAKLTTEVATHKKQIENLGKERDSIRDLKAKVESELAQTKEQHRKYMDSATKERDTIAKEKELISSKLSDAVKAHTEKLNAVSAEREKMLKAKEEALGQIRTAAEAHSKETQSLVRERDRLSQENRQLQQRIEESSKGIKQTQETVAQKTAEANRQRDEALAKLEQERKAHEKQISQLQKLKDASSSDREKAILLHKEAVEAKRGQWAVFGKEYNQIVKQRDDALSQLSDAKVELQKTAESVSKEKDTALTKLQKAMADQEQKIAGLMQKIDELGKQNEVTKAELKAAGESHQQELQKIASERDNAMKAQEEIMSLPRIRPVMITPPPVLQPIRPAP